jgi:hypothetical protein
MAKKIIGRTEKRCSWCNEVKPLSEFYKAGGRGEDCYCKPCRNFRSLMYQASVHTRRKSFDGIDRSTFSGFQHYMKNNPLYFQFQFHKKATSANIREEYFKIKNNF